MPPLLRRPPPYPLSPLLSSSSPHRHGVEAIQHLSSLLDACSRPRQLAEIHGRLLVSGLYTSYSLASKFISSAAALDLLHVARHLFDKIPQPNTFLFNTIIRSCSSRSPFAESFSLYSRMLWLGLRPDGFTLPPILKSCGGLAALGRSGAGAGAVHAHVLRFGFSNDLFVLNGVVAMYAKLGDMSRARAVFDRLRLPNVVSWTSIIAGFAQNGFPLEALRRFGEMRRSPDRTEPDFVTIVSVLKACSDMDAAASEQQLGSSVHGLAINGGFDYELDVLVALTSMYSKCGDLVAARRLFDGVSLPEVILWNAMITGYARNGCADEAVELFRKMIVGARRPDSITVRSAALAVARAGSMELANWLEGYLISVGGFRGDVLVDTAVMDMFAKCGSINRAHALFRRVAGKDVVAWSAIIACYAFHGRFKEAAALFDEMKSSGVAPNDVTFLGLLTACVHAGLPDEGWRILSEMELAGVSPRHPHFACVVDVLARAGRVEEAFELAGGMPMEPGVTVWGALLSACRIHGRVELGEVAARKVFEMDPGNAGHYVLMSNIYASAGMWGGVAEVRMMMKERKVEKDVGGFSSVDVGGEMHRFHVEEESHPRLEEIIAVLCELGKKLQEVNFFGGFEVDDHEDLS